MISILERLSRGSITYHSYKWSMIANLQSEDILVSEKLDYKFLDERIIEYHYLLNDLNNLQKNSIILDAGSVMNFDKIIELIPETIDKVFIQTLTPERKIISSERVSYLYSDLRRQLFKDGLFDYIVCISTLEHVAMDNTKLYGAREYEKSNDVNAQAKIVLQNLVNMLKVGGQLLLTVPVGISMQHEWVRVFSTGELTKILSGVSGINVNIIYWKNFGSHWEKVSELDIKEAVFRSPKINADDGMWRIKPGAEAVAIVEIKKEV